MTKSQTNAPNDILPNSFENLETLLASSEEWLMERILAYAKKVNYTAFTSTLKEAWRLSISGLTASIIEGIRQYDGIPQITPEMDFTQDNVAMFGITEAQRHRERGVSLSMFLGLIKYYRQTYIDLVAENITDETTRQLYDTFIKKIFDIIEIGFCVEWSGGLKDKNTHELQMANQRITNEKNKYLTIFESIPNPVIILNANGQIDTLNLAATRFFCKNNIPGGQHYHMPSMPYTNSKKGGGSLSDRNNSSPCFIGYPLYQLMPPIKKEIEQFYSEDIKTSTCEKIIYINETPLTFNIKFSRNMDISGKFDSIIIIMEDITSLKQALKEVHTLKGFIPICSHCKNIRDDKGFWLQVEQYMSKHSHAQFSHSICPECVKKYYGNKSPSS